MKTFRVCAAASPQARVLLRASIRGWRKKSRAGCHTFYTDGYMREEVDALRRECKNPIH